MASQSSVQNEWRDDITQVMDLRAQLLKVSLKIAAIGAKDFVQNFTKAQISAASSDLVAEYTDEQLQAAIDTYRFRTGEPTPEDFAASLTIIEQILGGVTDEQAAVLYRVAIR